MDLSGKKGLVLGVANKRSLAWAIAQRASAAGAELALTYQGERLEENVRELAATLGRESLILPCDVGRRRSDRRALRGDSPSASAGSISSSMARRSRRREALSAPFVETTREAFRHVARHQRLFAGRARARGEAADDRAAAASSR